MPLAWGIQKKSAENGPKHGAGVLQMADKRSCKKFGEVSGSKSHPIEIMYEFIINITSFHLLVLALPFSGGEPVGRCEKNENVKIKVLQQPVP